MFSLILKRDLLLALRNKQEWANPILFFVIVVSLFPLSVGVEPNTLKTIAPGVIWVAALLATLLSLNQLFHNDYQDGSLEQLVISPQPLSLMVLAKIIAYWLITELPLVMLSPLLGYMLHLSPHAIGCLFLSLLLGTPVLSFIGAIAAALTVSLRNGGVLLGLLILPLYVPVLIFGAGAVVAAQMGMAFNGQLAILGAMLVLALCLTPFAIAGALKIGVE
tara:strand:- start:7621 stop:8280 length:660 start_codon:yes stop_codon:yes gene_type:complete